MDDSLIRDNALIHGHNTDIEILKIDDKFLNLAVSIATNQDYENSGFKSEFVRPRVSLKNSKVFLREKLSLHRILYADERLLKLKLNGRLVRDESDLLTKYNKVGISIDPFSLPVQFVSKPYYYGNLVLLANLSDDEEFLRNMKIFFKRIELSRETNQITSICYVHEIVHTQLESLKGIVGDYYNSEVLSIFMEFVFASETGDVVFAEVLKNRLSLYLLGFDKLFKYVNGSELSDSKWETFIACKYIVSTLKAINLFNKYCDGNDRTKKYIFSSIQDVFDGNITLEEMLEKIDISYENSIDSEKVFKLIYR